MDVLGKKENFVSVPQPFLFSFIIEQPSVRMTSLSSTPFISPRGLPRGKGGKAPTPSQRESDLYFGFTTIRCLCYAYNYDAFGSQPLSLLASCQ